MLIQLRKASSQLFVGDVQRVDDTTGGEILVAAHVEDDALATVDQRGELAGADAAAAATQFVGDQQHQQDDEGCAQHIVVSGKFNQVGEHRRVPGR